MWVTSVIAGGELFVSRQHLSSKKGKMKERVVPKKAKIFGLGCLGLILLLAVIAVFGPNSVKPNSESPLSQTQSSAETKLQESLSPPPRYEILHTVKDKRYDGGDEHYVLIDPVDLSTDQFKEDIKVLVRALVKEKGKKQSFEFHDSRESLDISYKQYGDMSLGRPRTSEEDKILAVHYIAAFSGQLETGIYKNTLQFFLATFKDNPDVGKYVETLEFNP